MRAPVRKVAWKAICVLGYLAALQIAAAATRLAIPARVLLTNAVYFTDRTVQPNLPGALNPLGDSPAPTTSFYALGWDDAGVEAWAPNPDTYGAVGKDACVTMLNSEVRVQTRDGQGLRRVKLMNWWTNGHPDLLDFDRIADPRVIYDPFHDRWMGTVFVRNESSTLTNAGILVGVSLSATPRIHGIFTESMQMRVAAQISTLTSPLSASTKIGL